MAIIQSCCCWRSLRRGSYAAAIYTLLYFSVTVVTMGHFIEAEQRYLNGDMEDPESESFLAPEKITPVTVGLNITLLACSTMGMVSCLVMMLGIYKDRKFLLIPWIVSMSMETCVEIVNLVYLFYLQTAVSKARIERILKNAQHTVGPSFTPKIYRDNEQPTLADDPHISSTAVSASAKKLDAMNVDFGENTQQTVGSSFIPKIDYGNEQPNLADNLHISSPAMSASAEKQDAINVDILEFGEDIQQTVGLSFIPEIGNGNEQPTLADDPHINSPAVSASAEKQDAVNVDIQDFGEDIQQTVGLSFIPKIGNGNEQPTFADDPHISSPVVSASAEKQDKINDDLLDFSDGSDDYFIPNSDETYFSSSDSEPRKKIRNQKSRGIVVPESSESKLDDSTNEENGTGLRKERKKRKSLKERRADRLDRLKLRNAGEPYFTKKGKFVRSRYPKPLAMCRMKCADRIPNNVRLYVFEEYWNLGSYDERANYVQKLVSIEKKKSSKVGSKCKREYSNSYKLIHFTETYSICKGCLLKTLSETNSFLQTICEKIKKFGRVQKSERGRAASYKKVSEERLKEVEQHISKFPAYESHYSRSKTSKKYLSPDLSIESMFNLYKSETANPVCKTVYAKVFRDMNLSFKKPSVDTCNKCNLLQAKIKLMVSLSADEIIAIKEEFKCHQDDYESAYNEKRKDKGTVGDDTCVFAFDLQQCLPTPMLSTSSAFYKRQLWVYNLTIHDFQTNYAYCCMWPECTGGRGANQIASCIYDFIINRLPLLHPAAKKAIFYSDSCPGQNKNSIIATMFMFAVQNSTHLKFIEHKFLIPGHTHMEVDSDHALIERAKKRTTMNIHLPRDWYQLVRTASKREHKFSVMEMDTSDVYDFAHFMKQNFQIKKTDVNGKKFVWSNVRVMKYQKDKFGKFEYKNNFSDEEFLVVLRKKKTYPYPSINAVKKCYSGPIPISVAKKKDLLSLLEHIDPSAHCFYHNLLTAANVQDVGPISDDEE